MRNEKYIINNLFKAVYSKNEFIQELSTLTEDERSKLVVISIHDIGAELFSEQTFLGFEDYIQMEFWDIEEAFGNYKPITKAQGKELNEFIWANKDKRFLIHCAAGQSRSAGVACAVECIVNFDGDNYAYLTGDSDVKTYPRYSPNLTVYDAIIKV